LTTTYKFKNDPEHALCLEKRVTTNLIVVVTEEGHVRAAEGEKDVVADVDDMSLYCDKCGALAPEEWADHGISEEWDEV